MRLGVVLLLLSGCSTPEPADARGGRFDVECEAARCSAAIELEAGAPVRGLNRFLVRLTPAEAGLGAAKAWMLAHGHGSEGLITPGDPNEVDIDLFMAGRWELELDVVIDETADRLTFTIDVP